MPGFAVRYVDLPAVAGAVTETGHFSSGDFRGLTRLGNGWRVTAAQNRHRQLQGVKLESGRVQYGTRAAPAKRSHRQGASQKTGKLLSGGQGAIQIGGGALPVR